MWHMIGYEFEYDDQIKLIKKWVLLSDDTVTEMEYTITGPQSSKKYQKKVLKNFHAVCDGDLARVDRRKYLDQSNHAIPVMKYFPDKNSLLMGFNFESIRNLI